MEKLTRSEFEALPLLAQGAFVRKGGQVTNDPPLEPEPPVVLISMAEFMAKSQAARLEFTRGGGRTRI